MRFVTISSIGLITALGLAAPGFSQTPAAPAPAPAPMTTAPAVTAPAGSSVVIAAPEGYVFTEVGSITASDLKGVNIYDPEGKDVGEIADLKLGSDNALQSVITDVGGFLGMGEHRVALDPTQIRVYKNSDNKLRAYVTMTKDELKALPAYKAG